MVVTALSILLLAGNSQQPTGSPSLPNLPGRFTLQYGIETRDVASLEEKRDYLEATRKQGEQSVKDGNETEFAMKERLAELRKSLFGPVQLPKEEQLKLSFDGTTLLVQKYSDAGTSLEFSALVSANGSVGSSVQGQTIVERFVSSQWLYQVPILGSLPPIIALKRGEDVYFSNAWSPTVPSKETNRLAYTRGKIEMKLSKSGLPSVTRFSYGYTANLFLGCELRDFVRLGNGCVPRSIRKFVYFPTPKLGDPIVVSSVVAYHLAGFSDSPLAKAQFTPESFLKDGVRVFIFDRDLSHRAFNFVPGGNFWKQVDDRMKLPPDTGPNLE